MKLHQAMIEVAAECHVPPWQFMILLGKLIDKGVDLNKQVKLDDVREVMERKAWVY